MPRMRLTMRWRRLAHDLAREIMDAHARNIVSDRGDLVTYLGWVGRASELGIEIGLEFGVLVRLGAGV